MIVDGVEWWYGNTICGWTEELVEVLNMPRLQSLQQLTLSFYFMGEIFWQDCMDFLQLVSDVAPSVKKLSWQEGPITVTPNPTHVDKLAQQLVAKLVKFEEVHFSSPFYEDYPHYFFPHERPPRFGNGINSAILRALPAAMDEDGSELKVLTLHCQAFYNPADLAEARKKLTVNMI